MAQRNKVIEKVIRLADVSYPDAEIYLYGSRARGDEYLFSDWDFLILLNQKEIPFSLETRIMDDFYDIELDTGDVLSPLIYTKQDWIKRYAVTPLFQNIKKEGIKIR